MELEQRDFLRLARRWWWLLLLAPAIAGIAAQTIESRKGAAASVEYTATVQIVVNPSESTVLPSYGIYTYNVLIRSEPVLAPVIAMLKLDDDLTSLMDRVAVEPVVDPSGRATEIIEVTVWDTDPEAAAAIATAIGQSTVDYIGQLALESVAPTQTELQQQIEDTEQLIADTEEQISLLERDGDADDPTVQARLDELRDNVRDQQDVLRDLERRDNDLSLAIAGAASRVSLVAEAIVPEDPLVTPGLPIVSLSAVAGFMVAVAVVLFLSYLDTTVKPSLDFAALTGSPLLSLLPRFPRLRGGHQLFVVERPNSAASEAIRLLRTNVEFASDVSTVRSLAISSPGSGEGKSTLAANLAVAMAQAGLSAVLIDADLRKPSQHRIFGATNEFGLTTLLTHPAIPWTTVAVPTSVHNLTLIPSGPEWPTPADLLSRDRLPQILAEISSSVDVILLDTPPILSASDALVVADHVDGVLLACRSGRTRIDALQHAAGALHRGAIRIVGVVLTWQPRHEERIHPHPAPSNQMGAQPRRANDPRRGERQLDPALLNPASPAD